MVGKRPLPAADSNASRSGEVREARDLLGASGVKKLRLDSPVLGGAAGGEMDDQAYTRMPDPGRDVAVAYADWNNKLRRLHAERMLRHRRSSRERDAFAKRASSGGSSFQGGHGVLGPIRPSGEFPPFPPPSVRARTPNSSSMTAAVPPSSKPSELSAASASGAKPLSFAGERGTSLGFSGAQSKLVFPMAAPSTSKKRKDQDGDSSMDEAAVATSRFQSPYPYASSSSSTAMATSPLNKRRRRMEISPLTDSNCAKLGPFGPASLGSEAPNTSNDDRMMDDPLL